MYTPQQNGIARSAVGGVVYHEAPTPASLAYCYWELKTTKPLADSFSYVIVPDACVDIVFSLHQPEAFVMTPHTTSQQIDLGTEFHYVGIRLNVGVYARDVSRIVGGVQNVTELGGKNVASIIHGLREKTFATQQKILSELVQALVSDGTLAENPLVAHVIKRLSMYTVADIARELTISERQLRRLVRAATGFSPRELQKVINFQRSFSTDWRDVYADQSHYIHTFKQITHTTPQQYQRDYDVRNIQYSPSPRR